MLLAVYLNTKRSLKNFRELYREEFFVDKSEIISKINKKIFTKSKYVCITRPRRFGKTSIVDMLGAYYTKDIDCKGIFDTLNISKSESYLENLNKYNVINISFNKIPDKGNTYEDYINMVKDSLIEDITEKFTGIDPNKYFTISDMLESTDEDFIFIIDEWDYIFNNNLFEENQNDFLEFIRNLLKDKPYVALAYMTGVLPIKKYSSGSALNMFDEYTFLKDKVFDEYFGFTESETKELCERQNKVSFEEISEWYNGYSTHEGIKIFNPRSVNKALNMGYCESYWTNTGSMDEVKHHLKYNILEIRDDVIKMLDGESVRIIIKEEFRAGQKAPSTKKEIFSAMIILGFLSYSDGYLKIPNKEIMIEFENALSDDCFGYVADIIKNSERMLKATINEDADIVTSILHDIHNSEIPILQYNDENSLSCVVTLAYLAARDIYRIEREEKTGKGYADFTFHPRKKGDIPIILELKKDDSVDHAIEQIKDKEYFRKFVKENKSVLAVAICYDSKNKNHNCKFEKIIFE